MAPLIKPIYGENYDLHWQAVNVSGKTILDVGADVGSTATYFLNKGALLVYAVEGNIDYFNMLEQNVQSEPKIKPIFLFINNTQKWVELLNLKPDVVKVDCEGCEKYLLDVPDSIFSVVREWMIEAHDDTLFQNIMVKLRANNYIASFYEYTNHLKVCVA